MNAEYNQIVQKFGGPVSPSDCHELVWTLYVHPTLERAEQKAHFATSPLQTAWKGRRVFTAIVNSEKVNACALPQVGADYVLIYRGLLERVLGYAMALFSTKEVLPTIGRAADERPYGQTISYFAQRASLTTGRATLEPRCPVRMACALILSSLAIDIVLSHEFGHIVGGHFDLIRDAMPLVGIDEIGAQSGDVAFTVPLACIESDADHYASCLTWCMLDAFPFPEKVISAFASIPGQRHNMTLIMCSLAAHVLFRCLAVEGAGAKAFAPNRYPPAQLRDFCFIWDLLQRTRFAHGENRQRDIEVMQFIIQTENLAAQGGVQIAGHDRSDSFLQFPQEWYEKMGSLFAEYRSRLEVVRRSEVTWRPIWKASK